MIKMYKCWISIKSNKDFIYLEIFSNHLFSRINLLTGQSILYSRLLLFLKIIIINQLALLASDTFLN